MPLKRDNNVLPPQKSSKYLGVILDYFFFIRILVNSVSSEDAIVALLRN